jgi:hypothetical protein
MTPSHQNVAAMLRAWRSHRVPRAERADYDAAATAECYGQIF